jgi:DNA-binding NarL/FixJ family response regulator
VNNANRKVLLVDDEPSLSSEPLAFSLESRDFDCIIATDMSSAVTALEQNEISVVVTDIMMPPGNRFQKINSAEAGFHFIEYVNRNWPRLPIVCLSVIGDQAKIKRLTDRGIRYLRKGETPLSTAVEVVTAVATGRRVQINNNENSNRRR